MLISDYDDKNYPLPTFQSPQDAFKGTMELRGLKPNDMVKYLGTTSRFYEVMNGKRNLPLAMIRKLHADFGYDPKVAL